MMDESNVNEQTLPAPIERIVIDDESQLINMRWKTALCNNGESCWCRLIMPEENVRFIDYDSAWVVPDGSISKVEAEHICEIYNAWLESRLCNPSCSV